MNLRLLTRHESLLKVLVHICISHRLLECRVMLDCFAFKNFCRLHKHGFEAQFAVGLRHNVVRLLPHIPLPLAVHPRSSAQTMVSNHLLTRHSHFF